ncbi:hypothetical protein P885DRAFT_7089, partial [Corynascus similis CBS 632.67]
MSQPLFGIVPAGQRLITLPTESPTPTTFLYAIPPTPLQPQPQPGTTPTSKAFSHIAVFLLPEVVLPTGSAAAIYLVTPPSDPSQTAPHSRFLGGIGEGKESAVFRLNASTSTTTITTGGGGSSAAPGENVVIGISIEPAD